MEMYDLFDRYLTSITPSESELSRARTHRDTVASRIDLDGFVETVNSGSYIKKTALHPLEDIDLFVGIDVRDYVAFADGIRVDVVPGFQLRTHPGYYRMRDRHDARWRRPTSCTARSSVKRPIPSS